MGKKLFWLLLVFLLVLPIAFVIADSTSNTAPTFKGVSADPDSFLNGVFVDGLNDSKNDQKASSKKQVKNSETQSKKLNSKTKTYLKNIQDSEEEKKYLIKFKSKISNEKLSSTKIEGKFLGLKTAKVSAKAKDIEDLLGDEDVEFIELDQKIEGLGEVPYGVEAVKAPEVWGETTGDGVKVAVLDTGIASHSDLQIAGGASVIGESYEDTHGHGTGVAGVVAAVKDNQGIVGVAPGAELYAVKIMEGWSGDLSDAIAGVEWAIENDMSILVMSFGLETYSQIFKEVLQEAYDAGLLLVAASGNTGSSILYPAAYSSVIAVGAVDENNIKADFSSYGSGLELSAPGVNINSTDLEGYSLQDGTSFSAPHVAGVAALIWRFDNSLTNVELRAKLQNDALDLGDSGKDNLYGHGLVQANIESTDFTVSNESYFYEIFNITNYGEENEFKEFWLNGTGSIDDVSFTEGVYWIKIYLQEDIKGFYLEVHENGSLILQEITAPFTDDNFSEDGSSITDGFGWIDDLMFFDADDDGAFDDAFCLNRSVEDPYFCKFDFSQHEDECTTYSGTFSPVLPGYKFFDVCENGAGTCSQDLGFFNVYNVTSSTATNDEISVTSWTDCDDSESQQTVNEDTTQYYIFDQRRSTCINSTHWKAEGRYDSGSNLWKEYNSLIACGATLECDFDADQNPTSSKTANINPCAVAANLCNGTIEVNAETANGSNVVGAFVQLNGVSNGTTNNQSQRIITVTNTVCGSQQNISVFCANNQSNACQVIGDSSKAIDNNDDFESFSFDCTVCSGEKNLKITSSDVSVTLESGNTFNITVNVHSMNINEPGGVNVTIKGQDKNTGLIKVEKSTLTSAVNATGVFKITLAMDLTDVDLLNIYVDPGDKISESKEDNYVLVPFLKKKFKANLVIDTGYSKVDTAIKEYLDTFVDDVSAAQANVVISIGKHSSEALDYNPDTLGQLGTYWGVRNSKVTINGKALERPYSGLVGTIQRGAQTPRILIYGNEIQGTVAAVKAFVTSINIYAERIAGGLYFGKDLVIIDAQDPTGISVNDLMIKNDENLPYFRQNSVQFANIVTEILNDENFETSMKTVKTQNTTSYGQSTTLRLKHINTDYSSNYVDAIISNSRPVVLARGLWSNLFTWEKFGKELVFNANNARDTWLIEITGGPGQDDDDSPDYTYEDMVDHYWPALIAGVEEYSGQNKIDYVGFSNGCRAALDSLSNWSTTGKTNAGLCFNSSTGQHDITCDLSSEPVEILVVVGCPGAFNGSTPAKAILKEYGAEAQQLLEDQGVTHLTFDTLLQTIGKIILPEDRQDWLDFKDNGRQDAGRISLKLFEKYKEFTEQEGDSQPVRNLNVSKFMIIRGHLPLILKDSDFIVTKQDTIEIYDLVEADQKLQAKVIGVHPTIADGRSTKSLISKFLNNIQLSFIQASFNKEREDP